MTFIVKTRDPREIKSFPCSPRTANIAMNRWETRYDEANISQEDNVDHHRMKFPLQRVESMSRKKLYFNNNLATKAARHMKQESQSQLISKQSSENSESESYEESSKTDTIEGNSEIAKRAIQGAIDAQSSQDSSSRDTIKPSKNANYSSTLILPNDHIKLTKLKKELYQQKNICDELTEQNKEKTKQKVELQGKISKLKKQIEDMMNSRETYMSDSETPSSFVENKGVKATSTRDDWSMLFICNF